MKKPRKPPDEGKAAIDYSCPYCDKFPGCWKASNLRRHVHVLHPEIPALTLERMLVDRRYPNADIDGLVTRYKAKLETRLTFRKLGIVMDKYLEVLGVLRTVKADYVITQFIKPGMTEADVKAAMAERLVKRYLKASPEKRFEGYLTRDMLKLKNEGLEELIPAATALRVTKFIKQRLDKELEELKKSIQEPEEPVQE